MRTFKTKLAAIKAATKAGGLVANRGIFKYVILDDCKELLQQIQKASVKDFYEYIPDNIPVPFFFDIEIYNGSELYSNPKYVVDTCIHKVKSLLPDCHHQCIILESHKPDEKLSFHVVIRSFNTDNQPVFFQNVAVLKEIYNSFGLDSFKNYDGKHIVDPSVYRAGLFRTIHSSKSGEQRYLKACEWSDDFDELETFVGYHEDNFVIWEHPARALGGHLPPRDKSTKDTESPNVLDQLDFTDIEIIKTFVEKEFHHLPNKISDVKVNEQFNYIVISLWEKYCPFKKTEHKSNHQYIVIDTTSAKQKCHDSECNVDKHNEVKMEKYPQDIHNIIKRCLKVSQQELSLINTAASECKTYITENFDKGVVDVTFDRNSMVFRGDVSADPYIKYQGKCPECNFEHEISNDGYCMRCRICNSIFPPNQIIPVGERYKTLSKFWMSYSQLVNHGTIHINNYYNGEEEFSCDVELAASIFKNKELTTIFNQILDGHKVVKISELMSTIETNFVYTNGEWYFFNGAIWKHDNESLEFRKRIINLSSRFNKIQHHYESKNAGDHTNGNIIKNVKSLINKLHKTGFEDEIVKGAKMYYYDEKFIRSLNSKKHLVPFTNGVYDLLGNIYRQTTKEDYVNLTVAYDYYPQVRNTEVITFINNILPNKGVRDYVLKKMSECLNGDIPNTKFLMFIGDGANGKSQLLNLMKLAIGELGEKVEVTLLTRKRNNANEANTEKIKLMNKRFAFLSEPEDGEKINIGLLKELTGSEEIVARGLYQESVSFVMEAKLFLACNELPEIKGEDTALWRRIRVIDFPSRFVDDPKEANEYKIDRSLPSRMREDITWRQTFMNVLLEYYYKDVPEPVEVKLKTNEYRQENNEFYSWLEENVKQKDNSVINLKSVCELYLNVSKVAPRTASKYRKEIEKYIKQKYPESEFAYKDSYFQGERYCGWLGFSVE
jgi:P4 family phage/plasmid primase-like protien